MANLYILIVICLMASFDVSFGEIYFESINSAGYGDVENVTGLWSVTWTKDMSWKDTSSIKVKVMCSNESTSGYWMKGVSQDTNIMTVIGQNSNYVDCNLISMNKSTELGNRTIDPEDTSLIEFTLYANFLGHTYLDIFVSPDLMNSTMDWDWTNQTITPSGQYEVTVVNPETLLSRIFIIVVAILMVILNFGFGCRMQIDVLKSILRRPLAPVLGLSCQFIVMPLLGFGLTKVLPFPATLGFGLFVTAASPGGGGSNVWTVLLDGDLDLSMAMTFFSKTLALFAMPTWMFCLSRVYVTDRKIVVPYMHLFIGLMSLAVPCILGIILKKYKPAIADHMSRLIKPLAVLFLFWVIIVGSITNTYVYTLMATQWYVIMGGCLLPYLGMLFGFIIAKVACQPQTRVIAISLETGIQDTGVAILLLLASFQKPLGSLAATMPITSALFTPLPLIVSVLALTVYKRCSKASDEEKGTVGTRQDAGDVVKVMYCSVVNDDIAKLDQDVNTHDTTPQRMKRGGCRLASRNYKTRL